MDTKGYPQTPTPDGYILLSTFPEHGSRNVGDALITHSCRQLIREAKGNLSVTSMFRGTDLSEHLSYVNNARAILMPGLALRRDTWPEIYRLTDPLERLNAPLIGVGAGSKRATTSLADLHLAKLDKGSRTLLDRVVADTGTVACRDLATQLELVGAGYPTTLVGDCALYDPDLIGTAPIVPTMLRRIAFTAPRRPPLYQQAMGILSMLQTCWPQAEILLFRHGVPNATEQRVEDACGLKVVDVSGDDVTRLDAYQETDLHIGYRVHAHLYRLRTRRPSLLIEEDSRATGFNRMLAQDGVPATVPHPPWLRHLRHRQKRSTSTMKGDVRTAIERRVQTGFQPVKASAVLIDHMYECNMMPFLNGLP